MAGFNYLINLQILGGNAIDRLISRTEQFDNAVGRSQQAVDRAGGSINRMTQRGASGFSNMTTSVRSLITQLGIAAFTLSSIQSTAQVDSIDRAIRFSGGTEGAANLQFVNKQIDELALPAMAAKEGFKTLSGAMMGTSITAEQQRDIFRGVGEASTVMGLSSERTQLAMLALGQMASKGNVQMEELRGQLGEQIPGAMAMAARSMGVTNGEFIKMVEAGLPAEKFLPRFAAELHKTFGPGVADAVNGAQANLNRFNNSILDLKTSLGTSLMPMVTNLINMGLIPMFGWLGQNIDLILNITGVFGIWVGLLKTASIWQGLYTAATKASAITQLMFTGSLGASIAIAELSTIVTGGLTGAVTALSAAFWANPIMWVVGVLATLAIGITYAWNHFEGFRGFLVGTWEFLKEFAVGLYDTLVKPFVSIGQTIWGILSGDKDMIRKGIEGWQSSGLDAVGGLSERLGNKFTEGWNKGKGMGGIDIPGMMGLGGDKKIGAFFDVPGGDAVNSAFPKGNGAADAAKELSGGKSVKDGIKGITEGGTKNITINVGSLNEGGITVHTTNLKEGVDQVRDMFMRMYLEVINSGNQVQTSG